MEGESSDSPFTDFYGFKRIMAEAKLSPMMQQYMAIKDDYKDAILMYRLGDF